MKPFSPQPGQKPPSPAAARNAALINQLATPGLGSLMAGRWLAGIGQLALAVAGFVMVVVWFLEIMIQSYGQITGEVPVHPVGWIGEVGAILFAASWLWALFTSVSLLRQAKADEAAGPGSCAAADDGFARPATETFVNTTERQLMYKIVGVDGRQYGPVSAEEIRRWIAENRIQTQTLAHLEGTQEWKPLGSFPEFASELKAAPPLVAPPPSAGAARASNKISAGVCGILLGSFGIHKFILGYTGAGLVMLLVTVLTCGIAGAVMHLIGLIEGIIYLCKSDEEFVRTYVDGRKEWF